MDSEKSRKTICFLADVRSIHTQRWVGYFAGKYNTHLISFNYPESIGRVNVGIKYLSKKGVAVHTVRKLVTAPFVVDILLSLIKPDLVHAHFVTQYGFFGAWSHRHPLVITAWGDDVLLHPDKSKFYHWLVTYALLRADLLTTDGDNSYKSMVQLGTNAMRIKQIYFGIDSKKFSPNKQHDLNTNHVIYIRGFDPVYNSITLIKAIPLILDKVPNTKFMLIGDGPELQEMISLSKSLGVGDSVNFVGRVDADSIPILYNKSNVYVSTPISDSGLAASTAEAMSCGLPVVTTDVGDARLWIEDGVSGFIVKQSDPAALAEKVVTLLQDKELCEKFGRNSRAIILERQDYYTEMEKMDKLYEKLMEKRI